VSNLQPRYEWAGIQVRRMKEREKLKPRKSDKSIDRRRYGIVVESDNVDEIAEAINFLIENPDSNRDGRKR